MKIIREHFESIYQLINTINSRPQNPKMSYSHSSQSMKMTDWYGTKNYNEAIKLLTEGYVEPLKKMKKAINKNLNLNSTGNLNRRMPRNSVVGFVPNVPNAIRGLPESMINFHTVPQKIKAVTITYVNTQNANVDADEFLKSGITILNLINLLEHNNIRVKLNIAFKFSKESFEFHFATVTVKNWRDQLDLQKIAFPICHPSMLRRIGFKWLETCPFHTSSDYGATQEVGHVIEELKDKNFINENEYLFDLNICKSLDYDEEKLFEKYFQKNFF